VKRIIDCRNSKCGREIISETSTFYCKNCGSLHLNPKDARNYNESLKKHYNGSQDYNKSDKPNEDDYYKYKREAYENQHKENNKEKSYSNYGSRKDKIRKPEYVDKEKNMGKILGLKGKVTKNDIKKAWRDKSKEYHPDKVAMMGDELKELALKKTKEINEAYDYFLKKYFSNK